MASKSTEEALGELLEVLAAVVPTLSGRPNAPDDLVDIDADCPVVLEGYAEKDQGKPRRRVRVRLKDEACLVILPKKAAKAYGLQPCNNPFDLCVWDPVTGDVHCTGAE